MNTTSNFILVIILSSIVRSLFCLELTRGNSNFRCNNYTCLNYMLYNNNYGRLFRNGGSTLFIVYIFLEAGSLYENNRTCLDTSHIRVRYTWLV
ncbi:hypothetical protein L6452_41710 [Arctium lappa]|uniref:Uncharacterized protein n=1 Tax=Arctium lappa TaxID=4217 RepID=A0ACB8XPY2_ARCLA|nr:hypothetical protein L6452_41710 [Arctium lappa]